MASDMGAVSVAVLMVILQMLRRKRQRSHQARRQRLLKAFRQQDDKLRRQRLMFAMGMFSILFTSRIDGDRALWVTQKSGHWWRHIVNGVFTHADWRAHFRMSQETFTYLCNQLRPAIRKQDTKLRKAICVEQRVAITLWRLGTNVEYRTIAQLFGVGLSSVCKIVHEVCNAIVRILSKRLIRIPQGELAMEVIDGFEARWGFPQCFGAVDGSHLPIIRPRELRPDYYNRKGWYSIVLQGFVDHRYRFMNINVGFPGSVHDARVFANSALYHKGINGELLPPARREIGGVSVPALIVADSAYPLLTWVMKPYIDNGALTREQITFNYRLSRARMVTENAFGRLKGRWRILMKRNDTELLNLPNLITACCTLHNLCESAGEAFDQDLMIEDDDHHDRGVQVIDEPNVDDADAIRDALKRYFSEDQ